MTEPTVFIVDDDPPARRGLTRLVRAAGMNAEPFASATEFLAAERRDGPGCVVLDVRMPEMTGPELQEELSRTGGSMPIIFLSAYGDVRTAARVMKKGAIDFLTKPVDRDDLLAALRQALDQDVENRARRAASASAKAAAPPAWSGFDQMSRRRLENALANTTEAVWCMEFGEPLPLDLPEDEAIEEFYRRGHMVEVNDAMARIYGFESVEEMGEWRMEDYFDRDSESTQASLRAAVRARYLIVDVETVETPPGKSTGHYLNNLLPEIVDDKLVRLWGTSRDITELRKAEEQMRLRSAATEAMHVPILRSKLYRPPVAPDFLVRERLLSRLIAGRRLALTLVSAPAGFGKTTLMSHWLETCELPAAWLSLDETDSDTAVFLQYFVAAVRTLFADACRGSLTLAGAPALPPASVLAGCLSNDLDAIGERFVLVLDDYHRLRGSGVHELLDHLLSHPPRGLHLVIVSRSDPPLSLVSLRGRRLMTEIRRRDLRFASQETATFLEQAVGHPVAGSGLERLQERTEGWPVALRLVALALQPDSDVDELAHGIRGDSWHIREYLVAEVLSDQTPTLRGWLYKTSILERFCGPLAEAVCRPLPEGDGPSSEDGTALSGREFIRILESRGLLCVALDEQHEWYRYHHLFQEVLQGSLEQHLGREEIAALHARAAAWLESEGWVEEAIHHLLEGDGPAAAGRLVVRHRQEIMNQEKWQRLDPWLSGLPPEVIGQVPELYVLKAWSLQNRGRWPEVWSALDCIEAGLAEAPGDPAAVERLRAEIDPLRAFQRYVEGRGDLSAEQAQRALEKLPRDCLSQRGLATAVLAWAHQMSGNLEKAHSTIYDALATDPPPGGSYHGRLLVALCYVHWVAADLPAQKRAAGRCLALGNELGLVESSAAGCYFLGIAQYHEGRLAEAESSLAPMAGPHRMVPNPSFFVHSAFALAEVYEARGLPVKARETAQSVFDWALEARHKPLLRLSEAFQAELALRQGRIAEAVRWARQFELEDFHTPMLFYVPEITLAKALLAEGGAESRDRADEVLRRLEEVLAAIHNQRLLIETLALKAMLRDARDDAPSALELLGRAVSLALPGRWLRPFVDLGPGLAGLLHRLEVKGDALRYVGEILAAFQGEGLRGVRRSGEPPGQPSGSLPEPLTPRELEVLGLLAGHLSNREVAERLCISPGTVKRHAHSIYRKLAVPGRREAVTKALGLGILGDAADEDP